MFLLDTNVVSETARRKPNVRVIEWLARQQNALVSTISLQELAFGVETAPIEKRALLEEWLDALIVDPSVEIVPFDTPAAMQTGRLLARCRSEGRSIAGMDAQIAGTALARSAILVTRNTKHFSGLGVPLLDPFQQSS